MELMKLRRRLVLAERGHKLLKGKLEEIMRRFLQLMRDLYNLQEIVSLKLKKVFLSFVLVRSGSSRKDLERLIPEGKLTLATKEEKILNLTIPRFEIEEKEVSDYDFLNTESELDVGLKKTQELLKDLMEMSRLWKAVELLSHEIETTRRRVNALEHILIPSIKETISYISSRLEEMERSYQVQLMRVKDIVRRH
jgi:V/A-type H+-transporting ATPase subunit D